MFPGRWSLSSCDQLMHLCSLHCPLLTASEVSALPWFLFSGQRFETRHSFVWTETPRNGTCPTVPHSVPQYSHCPLSVVPIGVPQSLREPYRTPWSPLVPYRTPQSPCSVTGRNTGQCWVTDHSREDSLAGAVTLNQACASPWGPCWVRQAVNTLTAPHALTSPNQNWGHPGSQCSQWPVGAKWQVFFSFLGSLRVGGCNRWWHDSLVYWYGRKCFISQMPANQMTDPQSAACKVCSQTSSRDRQGQGCFCLHPLHWALGDSQSKWKVCFLESGARGRGLMKAPSRL